MLRSPAALATGQLATEIRVVDLDTAIQPARLLPHAALRLLRAALLVGAVFACPARADELSDATTLLRQKQHAQALDKINQLLATKPRDAQGRFLKGLILADQNKTAEAIDVFTKLTQDFQEMPEPYNNLATLYATQGQYEMARQALERSIRTHPSYATAYENLGGVYAKLASQAYDKALPLDSSNVAAKLKLSMVREIISSGKRSAAPAAVTAFAPVAPTAPAVPATPAAAPAAKAPQAKAPAPSTAPAEVPAAAKNSNDDVITAVQAWARAWAKKDVKTYLAHYAKDFKTPNSESRVDWEKGRKQRISAPKKIEVSVDSPKVTMSGDTATVTFRQHYRSDSLKVSRVKTLVLAKSGGKWLIKQERTGN